MKKNSLSLISAIIALTSFIVVPTNFAEGLHCDEHLYWFKVSLSAPNQACNQVSLSELNLVNDTNLDGLPNEVLYKKASEAPFYCTDEEYACALGFYYNLSNPNDPTNELRRVQVSPGVFQWQPKTSTFGIINSFSCCVYGPLQ